MAGPVATGLLLVLFGWRAVTVIGPNIVLSKSKEGSLKVAWPVIPFTSSSTHPPEDVACSRTVLDHPDPIGLMR